MDDVAAFSGVLEVDLADETYGALLDVAGENPRRRSPGRQSKQIADESSAQATGVTEIWNRPDWLIDAHRRLAKFEKLAGGWNGYSAEPPSRTAISTMRTVLGLVAAADLNPSSIDPSAEGGVCVSFGTADHYADIECFNTGEIFAVRSDENGEAKAWRVDPTVESIEQAATKIRGFLQLLN